jgi:hypothetical protein
MRIFNFLKSNSEHRKSIRVKTDIGDKFINVKFGQTYESMDILSLKIFQKDIYRLFDADYGIIVGRVLGQGVGIPNAKVSVFIPLDEEVIINPTTLEDIKKIEAAALYPYQTVTDLDGNGKIYNLLPKYAKNRNFNGFPDNDLGIGATPVTPVGTFPEKDEVLVNETVAYVYDKYLKFTTVTNDSGDYILTVPANRSYTVNMSCDITDIGRFSTTAALLKLEGYPDNLFTENGTQINEEIPLERLPNVDIQNQGITVKPLWTQDTTNTNVGINRLDFNLIKKIKPFSTVVGNFFTQNNGAWWGDRIIFRVCYGLRNLCIGCSDSPPNPTRLKSGSFFGLGLKLRICIDVYVLSWTMSIGFSFGLEPDFTPGCNSLGFCMQVKNIVPFFRILGFLINKYCQYNGGKNDYGPFELINLGATNVCTLKDALSVLTGINDDYFIQSHTKGSLDLRVFNIKNTVKEVDAQILNEENGTIINNNDSIFNNYSYKNDIELLSNEKYVFYQNNGSFIVLLPCNRNKVITDENGDLIPVDEKSEKGVFTSFRGYFYVKNDAPIDNPPTRNRTGKIALKIPQFVSYGNYNDPNSPFNKWIWKHFKFDFGKIYSVAQYNAVRYDYMTSNNERTEGLLLETVQTGFDEQTNILFVGAYEDTTDTPVYVRNNNSSDVRYKDFYNHATVLGIDDDSVINVGDFSSENPNGGQKEDQNNTGGDSTPPPPPPLVLPTSAFRTTYKTNITTIAELSAAPIKVGWDSCFHFGGGQDNSLPITIILRFNKADGYVNDPQERVIFRIRANDNDIKSLTYFPYDMTSVSVKETNSFENGNDFYKVFKIVFPANELEKLYTYGGDWDTAASSSNRSFDLVVSFARVSNVEKTFVDAIFTSKKEPIGFCSVLKDQSPKNQPNYSFIRKWSPWNEFSLT